jgi:A/G-specific adenine glycosylase
MSTRLARALPLSRMRSALLAFYDTRARDLPWRRTRDPYAIWVSEVMLQQTRVETVLRYYARFLERFPTTHALAAAGRDEVLAAWSGLGYYRRARLLHEGVREVVARYGGEVPRAAHERRALPGIGRYTAGAIGSIAFDLEEPLVDGNVARVLSRVHAIETPLGRADTERELWRHAEALCEGPRPGALNQALMELGATLCSKTSPRCAQCPLRTRCRAFAQGRAQELPVARSKAAVRVVQLVALILLDRDAKRVLLTRGEAGLFAGLWNLPMREGLGVRDARSLAHELGVSPKFAPQAPARIEHMLTHRHLKLELRRGTLGADALGERDGLRMCELSRLDALGISSLTRKALAALEATTTSATTSATTSTTTSTTTAVAARSRK